ncbi:MAG: hypothetical protein DMG77_14695 [Acidobacteria bacterium]|nr:MAG: hypothetical protein DMG77_14695 [Acidobacteriota bacterium]
MSRGLKTVPIDQGEECRNAVEDLKTLPINVFEGIPASANYRALPGQMKILVSTLWNAIVGVDTTVSRLGSTCDLFYDPWEKREDAAIAENFEILRDVISESFGYKSRICLRAAKPSEQEVGLQWADLLAGAFRHFFVRNDESLNWGSSYDLIPQGCWSERFTITPGRTGEIIAKRRRHLPDEIAELFNASSETYATIFKDILTRQSLSFFTHKGEKDGFGLGSLSWRMRWTTTTRTVSTG